jgi:sugar phosphate isomerase/epimerase
VSDRLRFGYGLNGFANHRLSDALAIVADLGYDGVALTLDHPHLDPLGSGLPARTAAAGALLARHGLGVVVETGARYVLDPWHKHEPTLVSAVGRERRTDLLLRAVRVAAELGAQAVSFWSGVLRDDAPAEVVRDRLTAALHPVLEEAARLGVTLAMEPEPGMFVDTLAGVHATRARLGDPEHLRVTVDIGHLRCNEDAPPAACVEAVGGLLANVQIDDMRRGVHEHLPFGEGEVDLPSVLAALRRVRFRGLVAVELPRHSHAAPDLARSSLAALREAEETARRNDLGGAA